jgi:hypothetical protein
MFDFVALEGLSLIYPFAQWATVCRGFATGMMRKARMGTSRTVDRRWRSASLNQIATGAKKRAMIFPQSGKFYEIFSPP